MYAAISGAAIIWLGLTEGIYYSWKVYMLDRSSRT